MSNYPSNVKDGCSLPPFFYPVIYQGVENDNKVLQSYEKLTMPHLLNYTQIYPH